MSARAGSGVLDDSEASAGPLLAAARALCASLTLEQKVAQITQLDVTEVTNMGAAGEGRFELDTDKLRPYAKAGVGSWLNSPTAGGACGKLVCPTAEQWRGALTQMEQVYEEENQVPPLMAIDSVHGANYVYDAPMFPHPLHVAASFEPAHAHASGRSTAAETRAAGVPWVFSPVCDIPFASRFPRVFETYGEDPTVTAALVAATVQGLQGADLDVSALQSLAVEEADSGATNVSPTAAIPNDLSRKDVVAACMKHFIAYQTTRSGYDRAPAWIPDSFIMQHFLPPFEAAIGARVASAMLSYNAITSLPPTISARWTNGWMRQVAEFDGLLITDWCEVYNQLDWHKTAATPMEAVVQALRRSTIDMAMVPYNDSFLTTAVDAVREGYVPESRLDEAVTRVLALKARLGMLASVPKAAEAAAACVRDGEAAGRLPECLKAKDTPAIDETQRQLGQESSLQAARDGVILLKNDGNALPLSSSDAAKGTWAVVGPNANSAAHLLGGWSVHWQGPTDDSEVPHVDSVSLALAKALKKSGGEVVSATGIDVNGENAGDSAVNVAKQATAAIIFVYGEGTYAEILGDLPSARLPAAQAFLIEQLAIVAVERGVPLVAVYVGGRDRVLERFDTAATAHLAAFYPGPAGGAAVADVLLGKHNPCARLPITLQAGDSATEPYWRSQSDLTTAPPTVQGMGARKQDQPLYPYAHGLSYTTFDTSALRVAVASSTSDAVTVDSTPSSPESADELVFKPGDKLQVTVTITNSGDRSGSWPVLVRVGDDACIVPPPPPMVKAFSRVHLQAGASTDVVFQLEMDAFAFEANDDVIEGGGRFVQPGTFTIECENHSAKLKLEGDPLKETDWVCLRRGVGDGKR